MVSKPQKERFLTPTIEFNLGEDTGLAIPITFLLMRIVTLF